MLSVIILSVGTFSAMWLTVIIQSVVSLNVEAPKSGQTKVRKSRKTIAATNAAAQGLILQNRRSVLDAIS
jgi:hypothetical protein